MQQSSSFSALERVNAKITRTMLGWEDHGIFTFNLQFDFGGSSQGGGQLCLGNSKGIHALTGEVISGILKAAHVDSWEKLAGTHVVVLKETGWSGTIRGIAPIIGEGDFIWGSVFDA